MCRYINQTLKNENNKFKNIKDFNNDDIVDDAEREKIIVIVNSNQTNQNTDRSTSRSRFEIFESSSRAIIQSSEDQMNSFNCYNCEKSKHFSRNCRQFKKMNLNNFVREMNVHDKNDSLSQENNLEFDSKKE
jgi:hypothetical protein